MDIRKRLMILGIGVTVVGVLATARPVDAQAQEARGPVTAVTVAHSKSYNSAGLMDSAVYLMSSKLTDSLPVR